MFHAIPDKSLKLHFFHYIIIFFTSQPTLSFVLKKMRKTNTILRIFDIFYILNNYLYFMYSGVTFLPMPSSISLSLLIVAQATVVSMFPVIVADAPDLNASSPSFVSSALPAPRRMSASGFIYLKNDTVRSISGSLICSRPSSG